MLLLLLSFLLPSQASSPPSLACSCKYTILPLLLQLESKKTEEKMMKRDEVRWHTTSGLMRCHEMTKHYSSGYCIIVLFSFQLTKFQSSWKAPVLAERFMLSWRFTICFGYNLHFFIFPKKSKNMLFKNYWSKVNVQQEMKWFAILPQPSKFSSAAVHGFRLKVAKWKIATTILIPLEG